jgi:hypothetical protein
VIDKVGRYHEALGNQPDPVVTVRRRPAGFLG